MPTPSLASACCGFWLGVVLLAWTPAAAAVEVALGSGVVARFADAAKARDWITTPDEFIERLSPFDRAARRQSSEPVTRAEFLEFVGGQVMDWPEPARAKVTEALAGLRAALEPFALPFPPEIGLVATTGLEEGGAAYTRGHVIYLPPSTLGETGPALRRVLAHELFHVLSRSNPRLRDRCYATIGFRRCAELEFPPALAAQRLTNPDAPRHEHALRVTWDGRERWAIPILHASVPAYPAGSRKPFFVYLRDPLLLVDLAGEGTNAVPRYDRDHPVLVERAKVTGFFEQVGRNTEYVLHPEEILADNFADLVWAVPDRPSPEVLERLRSVLKGASGTRPERP